RLQIAAAIVPFLQSDLIKLIRDKVGCLFNTWREGSSALHFIGGKHLFNAFCFLDLDDL
ncbi:MAG: hypothetical protein RJB03_1755, partial [Bacteroidota bacterium]